MEKTLGVVIVSFNTKNLTLKCLSSILNSNQKTDFDVYLVDNNSVDDTVLQVRKSYPKVKIIKSKENLGFGRGNNLALKKIKSKYALLLNSDTQIEDGVIDQILKEAIEQDFGITSCELVNGDGSFQPNAGFLPSPFVAFMWLFGIDDILSKFIDLPAYHMPDKKQFRNGMGVGWVSGSVMLIKASLLKRIGYFDKNIFMYGEDVDLCWRAKKVGAKIGWVNTAKIVHLGGGSTSDPHFNQWIGEFRGLLYLYNKYYGKIFELVLWVLIRLAISMRVISFTLIGKLDYAKTYAKIFIKA